MADSLPATDNFNKKDRIVSDWEQCLEVITKYAHEEKIFESFKKRERPYRLVTNRTIHYVLSKYIETYDDEYKEDTVKNSKEGFRYLSEANLFEEDNKIFSNGEVHWKSLGKALANFRSNDLVLQKVHLMLDSLKSDIATAPPATKEKITISSSPEKGRYVICTEPIRKGELLFVESPVASVINSDFDLTFCHNCCKRLTTSFFPCHSCNEVLFCCVNCRSNAIFHRNECGYIAFLQSFGVAYLALRCLFVGGNNYNDWKNNQNDRYCTLKELQYHWNMDDDVIFEFATTAMLLATFLQEKTSYYAKLEVYVEDISATVDALLIHMLQLIVNAQAVVYTCLTSVPMGPSSVKTAEPQRVATGIYPLTAMMNHSCEPSVITSFYGNVMVVRARKNLEIGEEVLNCYGPHYCKMPRHERQKILKEQYNFVCKCTACSAPIDIPELNEAFKCQFCSGPLVACDDNANGYLSGQCRICAKWCRISDEFYRAIDDTKKLLRKGYSEDLSWEEMISVWKLAQQYLYCLNTNLIRLLDEMCFQTALRNKWSRCYVLQKSIVMAMEAKYPEINEWVLDEKSKLAKICEEAAQEPEVNPRDAREFKRKSAKYKEEVDAESILLYGHVYQDQDIVIQ